MKKRDDNLYQTTGVYSITDIVNGMVYVGQTLMNFGDRRDSHFSLLRNGKHACSAMQADFALHGEANFVFAVLEVCDESVIDEREAYYIDYYTAMDKSYNKCGGGRIGYKGVPLTEEAKRKIGEQNRVRGLGRKASDATRMKMSLSRRGRPCAPMSEEARRRASVDRSGEKGVLAKLTESQVIEMRRLRREEHITYTELGRRFGVTCQCASDICKYKRWKYTP